MTQVPALFLKLARLWAIQPKTQSMAASETRRGAHPLCRPWKDRMRSLADLNTLACCVLLLSTLGCDSGDSSDAGFVAHEGAGNFEPSDDGSTPAITFGQLRVEGTQIVDATGEAIQLKGPSSMWIRKGVRPPRRTTVVSP